MYLVSYDITKTKVRNKVAKKLLDYGKRVQYSVFECDIPEKRYAKMYSELMKLMKKEEQGNIRIYTICGNCIQKITTIGVPAESFDDQLSGEDADLLIV